MAHVAGSRTEYLTVGRAPQGRSLQTRASQSAADSGFTGTTDDQSSRPYLSRLTGTTIDGSVPVGPADTSSSSVSFTAIAIARSLSRWHGSTSASVSRTPSSSSITFVLLSARESYSVRPSGDCRSAAFPAPSLPRTPRSSSPGQRSDLCRLRRAPCRLGVRSRGRRQAVPIPPNRKDVKRQMEKSSWVPKAVVSGQHHLGTGPRDLVTDPKDQRAGMSGKDVHVLHTQAGAHQGRAERKPLSAAFSVHRRQPSCV